MSTISRIVLSEGRWFDVSKAESFEDPEGGGETLYRTSNQGLWVLTSDGESDPEEVTDYAAAMWLAKHGFDLETVSGLDHNVIELVESELEV